MKDKNSMSQEDFDININKQLYESIERYQSGLATPLDTLRILEAFEPLTQKYISFILGKLSVIHGVSIFHIKEMQLLLGTFPDHGSLSNNYHWMLTQCKKYTSDELRLEVISTFLECIRNKGWIKYFSIKLGRNLLQLFGHPDQEVLVDYIEETITDTEDKTTRLDSTIQCILQSVLDIGIALTDKELCVITLLNENYSITVAADKMGLSIWAVYKILIRLKKRIAKRREEL